MNVIEVYSKTDCKLCDEAKSALKRLNSEFNAEIREILLEAGHPLYEQYKNSVPVIVASNGRTLTGKVTDDQLHDLLLSLTPPPRIYYVAKFLQALAIVVVFFGFMYGLMGDMWTDLYFFLGGIVIFLVGWMIEKQERHSRKRRGKPAV